MIKSLMLAVTILTQGGGYYSSVARNIQRWLKSENIEAKVVSKVELPSTEKLAFLVGFENPSASDLATLKAFRNRGGKMVVFYSASAKLGELMGVKPIGFSSAAYPGAWSQMNFTSKVPEGLPIAIRQTSTVLQRVRPIEGKSRVIATWVDRNGKGTGEPAWLASAGGFWMTHVLTADGDEDLKARLCAAIVGSVEPKKWNFASYNRRRNAKTRFWKEYALGQQPRRAEIHAVWDHTGAGLYPGNWPRTIKLLKDSHVTDLFVNVAGAGFAHYPSKVLPRSKLYTQEGDQLSACLKAAEGSGIRVHAWVLCFSGAWATPDRMKIFADRGWRLKLKNGELTEYLNPALPEVRAYLISAIEEIVRSYPVAGIHLDYVRWGDGTVKPKEAAQEVTRFVSEVRQKVRRPKWLTAAVYGKHPQCVASVGQDWPLWQDMNLIDYAVPMDYSALRQVFEELVANQSVKRSRAQKTIAGIGVTANESRLDAQQVIDQILISRKYNLAGNALFDLDVTLETAILPYLRLGIW